MEMLTSARNQIPFKFFSKNIRYNTQQNESGVQGGGRRSSDAGEAKGGEPTDETAALRVGIGDGANARKEDMMKLAESKKVAGTTFRVNPDASSTSMARKHKVGGFRGTKKVKDPSRLKRVGASAKQRTAFLELKAMD
ncbi:hypothetical protein PI124_g9979 [Phytophthora idaei]|nr:hypothetical protein PI124_g9979 [Phytophthora idaei]